MGMTAGGSGNVKSEINITPLVDVVLVLLLLLTLTLALGTSAGCDDGAQFDVSDQIGPDPVLPEPSFSLLPDLKVGDRVGVSWVQKGCGRCAACQSHVQQSLAGVPGVVSATVNLATRSARVEYETDFSSLFSHPRLRRAGAGICAYSTPEAGSALSTFASHSTGLIARQPAARAGKNAPCL